jgi:hypothetical protein
MVIVAARSGGMNGLIATSFYTLKPALFQLNRFDADLALGV